MNGALVLGADGLSKLAAGDLRCRARLKVALERRADVVVSAVTLAEVLRGSRLDAAIHRVLGRTTVVPVSRDLGRQAGELLGTSGLSEHQYAVDAVVAATALSLPRPVVLMTSDPDDLH
nr:hypothetical protein [Micromonospora sp. DSM 115978]